MTERDQYDRMTDAEILRIAKIRGIPSYKTDLFRGTELREYMRLVDLDEEDVARWDPA